ncbi:MAG TPA: aldo/keto reductase [Gaiellales bacterium]|nr:aldo/keto reductase [Gaiellales bacterium]
MTPAWLDPGELRVGLGCMRLSIGEERDELRALETIAAAVEAGVTVFDTARAYGDNERLLARALHGAGAAGRARIVTKGGMARTGGAWIPDGRAKAILADCEASLADLDGLEIDLYLIHAPDPRTPWSTSVRALRRIGDEGLARRVGVCNVNRRQLDEALELAPIAAVQAALSPFDDRPLRGGVVERCADAGIAVIAHSPLGGPRRAGRLARNEALAELAGELDAAPAEVALAWLLGLSPAVVAIPGARRPDAARSAAAAARLRLTEERHAAAGRALGRETPARRKGTASDADVVMVIGIPGAGKSRVAAEHAAAGYLRLNRDERGGTLRDLARALDDALAAGERRVVLDNTYLNRAARRDVIEAAALHGAAVRCIWLDTPLAQAQVNVVERLLDRVGSLPGPDELQALGRRHPELLAPTSQMRTLRDLEPPGDDEGFAEVERRAFEAEPRTGGAGVFVAAAAVGRDGWEDAVAGAVSEAPALVFDWNPDGDRSVLDAASARVAAALGRQADSALCGHPAGPPRCWCRPPLPGLPLVFAREREVDPARSLLIGSGPAHRTLAAALGARYVQPG